MQENAPAVPGRIKRLLQLLQVLDHPEAAQSVGGPEGRFRRHRRRRGEDACRGVLEQRLGGFGGQMLGQGEELALHRRLHVGNPVSRHADGQQLIVREMGEQRRRWRDGRLRRLKPGRRLGRLGQRRRRVFDPLANIYDLRHAGAWMGLDPPSLGPGVGFVVVVDIGEQQAGRGLVHDDAHVLARPDRPKIRVLGLVDPVHLQSGRRRVHLQIEGAGLGRLLVLPRQAGEGGGERVGDAEVHLAATSTRKRALDISVIFRSMDRRLKA